MRDGVVSVCQADAKLREEEKRALRYLETRRDCNSVQAVSSQSHLIYSSFESTTYYTVCIVATCISKTIAFQEMAMDPT